MTKKIFKIADQFIAYSFYFLFAIVPLVFSAANIELFEFPKMMLVYATTIVTLALWTIKSILANKVIFRKTFLDLPLLLFLLAQGASTFFSIDRHTSIWGYYTRPYGGLISTTTFAILYWAYVSNMQKRETKNTIRFLLTSAIVVSIWGIMEHFGKSAGCLVLRGQLNVACWTPDVKARVFASIGQPNWLAAWLAAIAPLTWALANPKTKRCQASPLPKWITLTLREILLRFVLYISPFLLFMAVLYTKSASGLAGFSVAYLVFWATILTQQRGKAVRSFLTLTFSFLILALALGTRFTPSIKDLITPTANQQPPTTNSKSTDSLAIRKIVWKGAVDIWKNYPILGSGPETFAYTYYNFRPIEHNYTSEWNLLYNKAHNEYLHYLANTGILGLATYLLLIGSFAWWTLRKMTNAKWPMANNLAFFAGYSSILITNLVGFTTVPTATLLFLYPAMAIAVTAQQTTKGSQQRNNEYITVKQTTLIILVACSMLYVLSRIAQTYQADVLYTRADKLIDSDQPGTAAGLLHKAVKLRPNEPKYLDKLSEATSTLAEDLSEQPGKNQQDLKELAQTAKEHSRQALEISPKNVMLWSNRATHFKRLASIDQQYLLLAIQALEEAVKLAPTEPELHYNLGVLYEHSRDPQKARQFLEKAVGLKPNYYDGRLGLGEFYLKIGEKELGIQQLEEAVKIDPRDKSVVDLLENLKTTEE